MTTFPGGQSMFAVVTRSSHHGIRAGGGNCQVPSRPMGKHCQVTGSLAWGAIDRMFRMLRHVVGWHWLLPQFGSYPRRRRLTSIYFRKVYIGLAPISWMEMTSHWRPSQRQAAIRAAWDEV